MAESNIIWTIGHSNRTIEEFISLLHSFEITLLADVRHFPGSKKFPHFNKETLRLSLNTAEIEYMHFIELGGRRKPLPDSKNTAWRLDAFRGYADHMQKKEFKDAFELLKETAASKRTAIMCSEAVWWSCHRSLISDRLKADGWQVQHIMALGKSTEHPFTSPAKIVDGELSYEG